MLQYVGLAVAPGLAIIFFILNKDRYNREPTLNLILSFLFGAVSIVPAIFFEERFVAVIDGSMTGLAIFCYGVVAFSEEFFKLVALRGYAYPQKSFDEPLDGIVYSVMVGMGFATIENINYVLRYADSGQGFLIGVQRMFLSVPAHATFAVIMGFFVGKAKFAKPSAKPLLILLGLVSAILFHGTYDFFLFIKAYSFAGQDLSEGLLIGGAVVSLVVAILLSRNLLRRQQTLSEHLFKKENTDISV